MIRLGSIAFLVSAVVLTGGCTTSTGDNALKKDVGFFGANAALKIDDVSRQRAHEAQQAAMTNARRTSWRGEGGIFGFIEPGQGSAALAGNCNDYTQTIYIDGRARRDSGRACRLSDGSWQLGS